MISTTQLTSLFALTGLLMIITIPSIDAHTPIANDYWDEDPDNCYLESELDNMRYGGSSGTGNSAAIVGHIGEALDVLNAEMNGIDLLDNDACSGDYKIEWGAQNLAQWGWLATASGWTDSNNHLELVEIDYNTDYIIYGDTDACWPYYDTEWIAVHELGHGIGLKHNMHWLADSMMTPNCSGSWEEPQYDDNTAIDTHY